MPAQEQPRLAHHLLDVDMPKDWPETRSARPAEHRWLVHPDDRTFAPQPYQYVERHAVHIGRRIEHDVGVRAVRCCRSHRLSISKRVGADDLPVVALAESVLFRVAARAGGKLQELFEVATGGR